MVSAVPDAKDLSRLESYLYEGDGSLPKLYDPTVRPQPFENLELRAEFYSFFVTRVVWLFVTPYCRLG